MPCREDTQAALGRGLGGSSRVEEQSGGDSSSPSPAFRSLQPPPPPPPPNITHSVAVGVKCDDCTSNWGCEVQALPDLTPQGQKW